ncbi:MAG TPA: hypothetical protein DCG47_14855 [Spirochaetaceae bacterium]|jgi:hypothetical protein|nr:hypothetical protein [Spirochaetaceae bacterium]
MKRSTIALLSAVAALLASCVSAPPGTKTAQAEAAPQRKERIEEYRTALVSKETRSFSDGLVDRISSYEYSPGLERLLWVHIAKPSVAVPVEKQDFSYDANGRLSQKSVFGPDAALVSSSGYEYDGQGRLTREVFKDARGAVLTQSVWSYQTDLKSAWRVLDASGVSLARTDYLYDGAMLVESRMFSGGGALTGSIRYEYKEYPSQERRIVAERYLNAAGGPDGGKVYERNADGRLLQETHTRADGRRERIISYEYGPQGELLKAVYKDGAGTPREYIAYEYVWRTDTRSVVYFE